MRVVRRDLAEFWRCSPSIRYFFADDQGQDIVEYALLASIIGVASVLLFPLIGRMGSAFSNWGSGVQSIWIPKDPTP